MFASLAAGVLALGWAGACGGSDDNDGSPSAGTGGRASTEDAGASPTRACVLNGTCFSCYDSEVCWEG